MLRAIYNVCGFVCVCVLREFVFFQDASFHLIGYHPVWFASFASLENGLCSLLHVRCLMQTLKTQLYCMSRSSCYTCISVSVSVTLCHFHTSCLHGWVCKSSGSIGDHITGHCFLSDETLTLTTYSDLDQTLTLTTYSDLDGNPFACSVTISTEVYGH